MAYSSDPIAQRGFVPPQNDQERLVMRRVQDLCGIAMRKGIARYSSFLSDREQTLAQAALNRESCEEYSFDGGYPFAERKILCIEPVGSCGTLPIACVQVECFRAQDVPAHMLPAPASLQGGEDHLGVGLGTTLAGVLAPAVILGIVIFAQADAAALGVVDAAVLDHPAPAPVGGRPRRAGRP